MSKVVRFSYINWKNESSTRRVEPISIWFGKTEFHPWPQWFLKAIDLDKNAERDFAMEDIADWEQE